MPDVQVTFTIPGGALWCLVGYAAAGLVAYLPLLAWANSDVSPKPPKALSGISPVRWALMSVLWLPLAVSEWRGRVHTRRVMAQYRAELRATLPAPSRPVPVGANES